MRWLEEVKDWSLVEDDGTPFEALEDVTVVERLKTKDYVWKLMYNSEHIGWYALKNQKFNGQDVWFSSTYILAGYRKGGHATWVRTQVASVFKELFTLLHSHVRVDNEKSKKLTEKLFPNCQKFEEVDCGKHTFDVYEVTSSDIEWGAAEQSVYWAVAPYILEVKKELETAGQLVG